MKVLLVQPPFAQLNAPYPAVHYLAAFLRSRGHEVRAIDHSIELYRTIFSRKGLEPAFAAARRALAPGAPVRDEAARRTLDDATDSQLERYLSYEELYLEWAEPIVDFLSGKDPAFAHRLTRAAEMPVGMRAEAYLDARDGSIGPDEAAGLATAILEDMGDLVSYALDPSFATVRYGERIAASASSFDSIRKALDSSPLLDAAYEPMLQAEWERGAPDCLLVSVPFPGCLLGALACARSFRRAFRRADGSGPRIVVGGGYVSTELRELRDGGIFDYCDYLSFDSGFGSLAAILEQGGREPTGPLYKTLYRAPGGRIVGQLEAEADAMRELEDRAIASVEPDYADADYGRYLQVVDSTNPMHRLWSDSPWLKYRLAQGCYWHRCEFCDTELDYVARFSRVDLAPLLAAADAASERTGLYGIHFVDEALPMASLLSFAAANRERARSGKKGFHYWGNVRFDGSWTLDRCEYLAASGLVAASGGIEIATEAGLAMTDKGFDLASLVKTLVAMKSAGLLVHAYLIYGFPGQEEADIVDSAEICRQLFAAGLVDSAFWHRFVLTRHSHMYAEWKAGRRPNLAPIDRPWDFANNDLRFEGELSYDKFDGPLSALLEAWMSGDGLEEGAADSLTAAGLRPRRRGGQQPEPDAVELLVETAQAELDAEKAAGRGRAAWVAGLPIVREGQRGLARLAWTYRGEARSLDLPRAKAESVRAALAELAASAPVAPLADFAAELGFDEPRLALLREAGLLGI